MFYFLEEIDLYVYIYFSNIYIMFPSCLVSGLNVSCVKHLYFRVQCLCVRWLRFQPSEILLELSKRDLEVMYLVLHVYVGLTIALSQLHEVLGIESHHGSKTLRGCDSSDLDVFPVDILSNHLVQILLRQWEVIWSI